MSINQLIGTQMIFMQMHLKNKRRILYTYKMKKGSPNWEKWKRIMDYIIRTICERFGRMRNGVRNTSILYLLYGI